MFATLNSILHSLLPNWLYQRLIGDWNKEGLKKYASNTGWMFAARGATFITSFFTIAVVARYLGPENLGKLSYAQSFVSIISVFASLGIDQILFRDLAVEPEREKELLGTAIFSKLFFGAMAFLVAIFASVAIGNEPILTILIAITAGTFLLNPVGTISVLFQSRIEAKYASQITIFLALFIPFLKLLVVFFDKGIIYFSLILLVEAGISTLWMIYIYIIKLHRNPFYWRFSRPIFTKLIHDSWPLLLASLSGYIYGRIDQVMIQHYMDSTAVGFYDIAVRLTEYLGLIPGVVIGSVLPAIISAKKRSHEEYIHRLKSLLFFSFGLTLIPTIFVFIFAPFIVNIIFGTDFTETIGILRIYVWSMMVTVFVLLIQQYFIIENKSLQYLAFSIFGASMNVCLNIFLIPRFGMQGAAYATVITLLAVVMVFILKQKCLLNK